MIIDLQRRLYEAGRIRIGQQVPAGRGKTRPVKLDTFRLTSADRARVDAAARLYGGTVAAWPESPSPMEQWQVVTAADSLDVMVPPGEMAFSQYYELWARGGCSRRCNGRWDVVSDAACACDPEARECAIHTRLSVILRDLSGLGVWRLDTQGYYAAVELGAAVDVLQLAAERGRMLPARLRLEQRQVKRPGQGARKFAVPVLDVDVSVGQLMAGGGGHVALAETSVSPLTPVPAVTGGPSVAEQVATTVDAPAERPARSNAAAKVARTGRRPRTAAEVRASRTEQPDAGAIPPAEPPDDEPDRARKINADQVTKVVVACKELDPSDEFRHELIGVVTGGLKWSSRDLTSEEMQQVLAVVDLTAAGHVALYHDGPGDKPILRKPDGVAVTLPLDLDAVGRFLARAAS